MAAAAGAGVTAAAEAGVTAAARAGVTAAARDGVTVAAGAGVTATAGAGFLRPDYRPTRVLLSSAGWKYMQRTFANFPKCLGPSIGLAGSCGTEGEGGRVAFKVSLEGWREELYGRRNASAISSFQKPSACRTGC